jgi:predicted acetyltransferase
MNLELHPAQITDKPPLRNLLQLCLHDYSEFNGEDVDEHGIFDYGYLDYYWTEPGRYAFLARVDGKLAGFALVRQPDPHEAVYHLAEFFILRKYRGQGTGRQLACYIFDRFTGQWMVSQEPGNLPAQAFWRKVIADYTKDDFTETYRDDAVWHGPTQIFITR